MTSELLGDWTPLIFLIALLPPLYLLQRWINRHLQGLGLLLTDSTDTAIMVYFLTLLPGIALHELSHWLAAVMLRVPVGGLALWPRKKRGGQVRLGSVSVGAADPVRASLIGLAPLVAGCGVILLVGQIVLGIDDLGRLLIYGAWADLWRELVAYWHAPDFPIWLYLIFAVANAMLPSESDRGAWPTMALFFGVATVIFGLLGGLPSIATSLQATFLAAIGYLAYALGLAAVVDAVFVVAIALTEELAGRALKRRVEY
ncbi:MAG: hypothetical protein ACOYZ7_06635 [Chloroflexota bacterium]